MIQSTLSPVYPSGTVRALLDTDAVTSATRKVLCARLDTAPAPPRFFTVPEMKTLRAVCDRLIPQPERATPIELAASLDERLANNKGNGWRYDALPPDAEAFRWGLRGLDESARVLNGAEFAELNTAQQDAVLRAVQNKDAAGPTWQTLPPRRFFEELLAEVVECYYAHPLAQEEIGCVAMADAPGWTRISLNEREEREPLQLTAEDAEDRGEKEREKQAGQDLKTQVQDSHSTSSFSAPRSSASSAVRKNEEVDAVVIGTGAGGAPLLARLAGAGLKVVALEAGPQWNPARDFATDERSQDKLFWTDERLSAGADPVPFGNNNSGIGVGGSTLHYTAYTPRVQPDDLCLRSQFGAGCDWPLSYTDLEPYYDELEQFLGISGPSTYPWGPPRKTSYPLASLPLNGAAQLMQRGCAELGIRTSPAANAALSARYFQPGVGWRNACTNRGFCQVGCSTGAKASTDVTFIPLAIGCGAEVRAESFVTQIETDKSGRITGVVYIRDGKEERQKCRHLFLCAGAIETPRLLLMNGLANGSGQVGRNFMAHTGIQLWGRFDDDVRPYKGIPGALISEDTHRPKDADFVGGYLLQSIGVMPVTYASQVARGRGLWGEELREHMAFYNHTAGINILGECLPSEKNFLELSGETDARGLPKPRVHFTNGDNEKRLTAHAEKLMRQIWDAAGAREAWAFPRNAHIIGTCRMGEDRGNAVVNADGRAFDVRNLTICDNSIFPSALSVNPALTIMALSLRTADRFLERVRKGDC